MSTSWFRIRSDRARLIVRVFLDANRCSNGSKLMAPAGASAGPDVSLLKFLPVAFCSEGDDLTKKALKLSMLADHSVQLLLTNKRSMNVAFLHNRRKRYPSALCLSQRLLRLWWVFNPYYFPITGFSYNNLPLEIILLLFVTFEIFQQLHLLITEGFKTCTTTTPTHTAGGSSMVEVAEVRWDGSSRVGWQQWGGVAEVGWRWQQ